jgi:hypothetical protein
VVGKLNGSAGKLRRDFRKSNDSRVAVRGMERHLIDFSQEIHMAASLPQWLPRSTWGSDPVQPVDGQLGVTSDAQKLQLAQRLRHLLRRNDLDRVTDGAQGICHDPVGDVEQTSGSAGLSVFLRLQ